MDIQIIVLENLSDMKEFQKLIPASRKSWMKALFLNLKFPITVVYEQTYVDKLYRDLLYIFFQ